MPPSPRAASRKIPEFLSRDMVLYARVCLRALHTYFRDKTFIASLLLKRSPKKLGSFLSLMPKGKFERVYASVWGFLGKVFFFSKTAMRTTVYLIERGELLLWLNFTLIYIHLHIRGKFEREREKCGITWKLLNYIHRGRITWKLN